MNVKLHVLSILPLIPVIAIQEKTSKVIDSPADSIEAVESAKTPIVLDFDETLFLRNSTEAYLDAIYPRPLGAALLLALKLVRPWRWLPARVRKDEFSKDWFFVLSATLLFPWTPFVWRYKAKSLAKAYWNRPLLEAIAHNPDAQVIVATLGFSWIVNPLMKHLPNGVKGKVKTTAIACGLFSGASDRAKGKLAMVTEEVGEATLSEAVVVTDSMTDAPLLSVVKTPCLVVGPDAKYVPAMAEYLEAIAKLRSN